MENIERIINIIFNSKVGIIIASTVSILLILAYIFSKTSIGRKALHELRLKATSTRSLVDTHRTNVDNNLKEEKEKNDKKLKEILEVVELERQEMFEVLKLVPNAKVKKFVKDHEIMSVEELLKHCEKHEE